MSSQSHRQAESVFDATGSWTLTELLPDDSEATLSSHLERLEGLVFEFESHRSKLSAVTESSEDPAAVDDIPILEIVEEYERLVAAASRLAAFGELAFAADTRSPQALAFRNRLQQKITELQNRTLYFGLWWQGLSDQQAQRVLVQIGAHPGTADRVRYLEDQRRLAPFRLDESSEQIINLKDADGISGILTLYSMVTNSFEFRPEIEGAEKDRGLTRDELMTYVHSSAPEERAACYRELFRVYGDSAPWLAQMYVHRVRDWQNEHIGLRGYRSAISVRNTANDVSDRAVSTLLDVVRDQAPVFRRYFERKASWLGLSKLRRYDIYAPLRSSTATVPYAEGVALVLDTFSDFDSRLGALAREVFERQHVDSEPRPGKKGGAFCATVAPDLVPWVLVNYSGKPRDVATLAHELGHAVHSELAAGHTILTQQPSLPMAETASVFGELLVTNRLLEQASDPLVRRELLASALDDIYATVLRQAYFVRFEIEAHRTLVAGGSPEALDEIYRANLAEQFGDSVDVGPEFAKEWQLIPHIYSTPFYCYAYSFGQLLVLALYRRYLEEGERFKPGYLKLLAYGGSAPPARVLAEAGIDIEDAAFWRGGFEVVDSFLDQLEAIAC